MIELRHWVATQSSIKQSVMSTTRRHVLLAVVLIVAPGAAWDDCRKFKDIYATGKELCEKMWGDSFAYQTDESKAYTMWFFDAQTNP